MADPRAVVRLLAGLVALVVLATGCATIPTSGPVTAGAGSGDEDPGVRFQPIGPTPGASPEEIVRGFLLAASGVQENELSRAYLTPDRTSSWRPSSSTLVYGTGTVSLTLTQGERVLGAEDVADPVAGAVTATLTAGLVATVDDGGRYTPAAPGATTQVVLTLDATDAEWRISALPDQLVIDEAGFDLAFDAHPLYFVDPEGAFLVPEVRWFAERDSLETTLVSQLLLGPSPWLAVAVTSGFPEGLRLGAPGAVPVEDGEAQVDLERLALRAGSDDLALMQAQLLATLRPLSGVSSVRMTVGSADVVLDTRASAVRDPAVDPVAVLVQGEQLVQLGQAGLEPVAGLPALTGLRVSDPGRGTAAYAVLAQQRSQLLHLVPGTDAPPQPLLTGVDLTAPSFDPLGWIWSTSALTQGAVTAVTPDGEVSAVAAPWLAGRRVEALRISRDGTRALVTSSDPAGAGRVDVAGVQRQDGRPVALAPASQASLVPALRTVGDAAWVDESQVAVLGTTAADPGTKVYLVRPAGPADAIDAPQPDAASATIAAARGERSLLVGTTDGSLWQRAGTQWGEVAQGVRDPAFVG